MRVLITGSQGQLGSAISKRLQSRHQTLAVSKKELNITDFDAVLQLIDSFKPNLTINCAAFTDVEKAEKFPELAKLVNSTGTQNLALAAKIKNSFLIHFSTDYVFDGQKGSGYTETDRVSPLNKYGLSKAIGDMQLLENFTNFLIFRVAWVYGPGGNNFPSKILSAALENETLKVVDDQNGTPTSTEFISECVSKIILKHDLYQIGQDAPVINLVPNGHCNWHEFAKFILFEAKNLGLNLRCGVSAVSPIKSHQTHYTAQRPKNVVLDNYMAQKLFGFKFAHWSEYTKQYIGSYVREQDAL
jgi:dTDP-4-dehydrorhamnose reductase